MAACAARPSGLHIRAAGTTAIPVRSEVSCDHAAQTWNESDPRQHVVRPIRDLLE